MAGVIQAETLSVGNHVLEGQSCLADVLVFLLERGRKRDFRKHVSQDAACRDLLGRPGR